MISGKNLIKISLIFILAGIIIILYINYYPTRSDDNLKYSVKDPMEKNLLAGRWKRTEGNYIINISKVNEDGTLKAEYFNPSPINVETANWENSSGNLKVTIVLRDVNYPGSTYKLNYLADEDIFAGEYFQAVDRVTFYVEFVRVDSGENRI